MGASHDHAVIECPTLCSSAWPNDVVVRVPGPSACSQGQLRNIQMCFNPATLQPLNCPWNEPAACLGQLAVLRTGRVRACAAEARVPACALLSKSCPACCAADHLGAGLGGPLSLPANPALYPPPT